MFSVTLISILLILSQAEADRKYGCLIRPGTCTPPNHQCRDDGFIGDCVATHYKLPEQKNWQAGFDWQKGRHVSSSKSNNFNTDEYKRLALMVRHVGEYLRSNDLDFSDLSENDLDQLASRMAKLFVEQKEDTKNERMKRLIDLLNEVRESLTSHGIDIDQLNDAQMEMLTNVVIQRFSQIEDQIKNTKTYKMRSQQHKERETPIMQSVMLDSESESPNDGNFIAQTSDVKTPSPADNSDPQLPSTHHDQMVMSDSKTRVPDIGESQEDTRMKAPKNNVVVVRKSTDESSKNQDGKSSEGPPVQNVEFAQKTKPVAVDSKERTYIIVIVVVVVAVTCIVIISLAIYCMRSATARKKALAVSSLQSDEDYQALCRQHYASKSSEQAEVKEPLLQKTKGSNSNTPTRVFSPNTHRRSRHGKGSRNSSLSSWSEEPITTTLDISTGHAVLSYMEDHLNNKGRLSREWEGLCKYQAENVTNQVSQVNSRKNRSQYAVPYDHNRVKLNTSSNPMESDYINASFIIDNDPRWPLYIATQGPLSSTIHHFWQMVWEQGCVVIVMLTPLIEEGVSQCARYWPDEGSSTYNNYEIHLVSEHIWCEDYLVRSLYLKNLDSGETRTVTQFHFLSWPLNGIPSSPKQLLELRRKVSKCYRGNGNSPVVVHCSDGCGRTGSYVLLDLVIARMIKGTCKEIDIAATLEHLRDQRAGGMVATKEQLEFALACVADEVNAILKVLLQ